MCSVSRVVVQVVETVDESVFVEVMSPQYGQAALYGQAGVSDQSFHNRKVVCPAINAKYVRRLQCPHSLSPPLCRNGAPPMNLHFLESSGLQLQYFKLFVHPLNYSLLNDLI
eukprot:Filipodium_phascolosomae@DN5690_c0_g1_i1.p1